MLAVALVLGLMGWLGIQLDMATALVASVALGLSVDDTFHCLLQFHRHRQTQGFRRRLFDSYRVSGPGVILSSLAVAIGFAALRASEFEPFVNFGTMVGIATAGSTLGNLVLLPACLTLGRRWRGTPRRPQGTAPPGPPPGCEAGPNRDLDRQDLSVAPDSGRHGIRSAVRGRDPRHSTRRETGRARDRAAIVHRDARTP